MGECSQICRAECARQMVVDYMVAGPMGAQDCCSQESFLKHLLAYPVETWRWELRHKSLAATCWGIFQTKSRNKLRWGKVLGQFRNELLYKWLQIGFI